MRSCGEASERAGEGAHSRKMRTVGIIGLGLIGGSMALDLRSRGFADTVLGVESNSVNACAAEKIGLVDAVVPFDECIVRSDIIIVAIPVDSAIRTVKLILDRFQEGADTPSSASLRDRITANRRQTERDGACSNSRGAKEETEGNAPEGESAPSWKDKIVIDVCSTKEQIAKATRYHPARKQYVATHPMAGTEYSGPWAAQPGLFDGRACIFADAEESSPKAVKTVGELYDTLNMRPIHMGSAAHDVHTAYVSHISHVTSFALALTVLEKEKDEKHIFDLASGGFSSTVRLAKSSADMWVPILTENRDNVLRVMDTYLEKMEEFRDAVDRMDEDRIRTLIAEANRIKKIIR